VSNRLHHWINEVEPKATYVECAHNRKVRLTRDEREELAEIKARREQQRRLMDNVE
jgi:hypothetical protein